MRYEEMPHYWLGRLSMAAALAVRDEGAREDLGVTLREYLASPVPFPQTKRDIEEVLKDE